LGAQKAQGFADRWLRKMKPKLFLKYVDDNLMDESIESNMDGFIYI
jgi:hypothetical protein